ncbi:cell division protein FtsA [Bacillus suaedae]|uniref:Rod shape-determining protein n=1 Tax=Halalkalibacter suaedae TaxID=2822140 RepID=A0A940WXR5_9BACI|nr:cell division FtsA domain-containing protein [Bacillus suaedae]MBP3949794.1 rod shape-determining protein [Bacillus suaedae]
MTTKPSTSPLFALDIGTRSVVGLLLEPQGDTFELIDSYTKEHAERAMLDGQIHDVPSVAKVIEEIKHELEQRHGPLKKVCVAAAGRSLKTIRSRVDIDIQTKPMLTKDDLLHLELSAVQHAQFQLANEQEDSNTDYYCVGYSVLVYLLDNEPIGSLLDQTGKDASVEVIATFLPKVVVESLLAALARANLELEALTLEPIAAINVLIPPSMRRLNVALVDIGAGTSDIALTDENTVIAYGMVPVAGDEITEAISDHFLLDFPEAEILKRELTYNDTVEITDILGMETTLDRKDVIEPIENSIKQLARTITDEILKLNGHSPKAVMLVGGGSLTPKLPIYIAEFLDLPVNRVAIRGADAIKKLVVQDGISYGPELVTPIGIAIAAKENPIEYISVTVNNRTLRLFDVKTLTVGDGLLAAGIDIAKLYGKPGLALMVTVQNQLISVPGEHGEPPILIKNGEKTMLDAPLAPNDKLIVERGKSGQQASITIEDLLGDVPLLSITLNNMKMNIPASIMLNSKIVEPETHVNDRDHITVEQLSTIKELARLRHIPLKAFEPFRIHANNETWEFTEHIPTITVNGKTTTIDAKLEQHDIVTIDETRTDPNHSYRLDQLLKLKDIPFLKELDVFYNDEPLSLSKSIVEVYRDDKQLNLNDSIFANDRLILRTKEIEPFILQDIFTVIDIDIASFSGKKLSIEKNNEEISFSCPLVNGDRINIYVKDSFAAKS